MKSRNPVHIASSPLITLMVQKPKCKNRTKQYMDKRKIVYDPKYKLRFTKEKLDDLEQSSNEIGILW